MAITWAAREFFLALRDGGHLLLDPTVLELGQANWYGDVEAGVLIDDVFRYAKPEDIDFLLNRLAEPGTPQHPLAFIQADAFYRAVLRYDCISQIDLNGTPAACPYDLNLSIPCSPVDIVINSGTAEHIWNQDQFFRTAHDACKSRGLMVHFLPCWGWLDHGFVNYHPTFVADLAAANGYEILKWWLHDMRGARTEITCPEDTYRHYEQKIFTGSTMQAAAYRKTSDSPFQTPQQGYYARLNSGRIVDVPPLPC